MLTDLQRVGKIRYFGSSTFLPSQVVQAQWAASVRHSGRFVSEQPLYSMLVRGIERELLPVTQECGMGTLAWSPLAGERLASKWRKGANAPETHHASAMGGRKASRYGLPDPINQRKLYAADALAGVAEQAGVSLTQLAIAFTIRHPG